MKYRFFAWLLAACMLLWALPVYAAETTEPTRPEREPGWCGENIIWEFHEGSLYITGTGEMDDFPEGAPWEELKPAIVRVYISDGITYIGANAFRDYDVLLLVEFGKDVHEIGADAFHSCDGLTEIRLPESFKVFGESSFMSCRNLKQIHCEGKFPSFRQNCLWDTYAAIYFPAERPWGVEYIQQLEEAFKGRIEFLASDGTDPYVPTEPTEATTQPPTEAPTTVPPTTQVTTEPVTEPATEPPAPTEREEPEETTALAPTAAPETEPVQPAQKEDEKTGGTGWIGGVIVAAVLLLLILGRMAFGGNRKGKYSK